MTTLQLAYNATTKVVKVQMPGDTPGTGFTDIGDIYHPNPRDELGENGTHVLFHHVRDELYKEGQLDMSIIDIQFKKVTGISTSPATATLAAAATQQLTTTVTPADASNRNLTYSSSNEAVATVNATGLITAVATGEATITVTSVDGSFTDTCVVTVSA